MDERQGTEFDTTNQQWSSYEQGRNQSFRQSSRDYRTGNFTSEGDIGYTGAAEDEGIRASGNRSTMSGQNGARNMRKFEIDSLRDAGRARMQNMRNSETNSTQGTRASDTDNRRNVRPSRTDNVQKNRVSGVDSNQNTNTAGESNTRDAGKRRVNRQRNTGIEGGSERQRPNARGTRRNSRARRRRRNLIFRMILIVVLLIVVVGGFLFWRKYGPSKEEADLKNILVWKMRMTLQ